MLAERDGFKEVTCPACSYSNEKISFIKNQFSYKECLSCGMLYISPRPTDKILSEFYSVSSVYKVFNDFIFPASAEVRRAKIFRPRVQKVHDICKELQIKTHKILEIGTGSGLFCEEMVKMHLFEEVVGVEASSSLAQTCSEKGFRVYNGILEELDIQEKFNVVVAFEVIEHIANPKKFLEIIYDLLDSQGILVLTFPNYDGFDISLLQEKSMNVDFGHLNYFTEDSIAKILIRIGFQVISISTPGILDVDIVRNAILDGRYTPDKFIKSICLDNFDTTGEKFQAFLIENKLSSNMMVVAQKNSI